MNYPPNGYPFNPYPLHIVAEPEDEIKKAEKWLEFVKKIKDKAKEEAKDDKPKDQKGKFNTIEWFMMLFAFSTVIQTILMLWLVRGR